MPHFEKMLYDNAQLIDLLTLVWQETGNGLYAMRVAETVDWIAREMLTPEGGFSSSLDADSEHEEGKFYVWSAAEIDALLGEHAPRFKEFYDVADGGNWEGHTILNRLRHLELADPATEAELSACRAILFHAREERVHPGLDDKVLADWNGLMITALANAATVFERPDWLDYATDAFAFIAEQMSDGAGRLFHASRGGKKRHAAVLDDYANMSRAALALYEATGEADYRARAEAWVAIADRHYWDASGGAYFFTADDTEALIARTKTAQDSPNPSGNGVMIGVLARLFYITGKNHYRERAERIVAAFAGDVERQVVRLRRAHQRQRAVAARAADRRARPHRRGRHRRAAARDQRCQPAQQSPARRAARGRAACRASGFRQGPGRRPRHRLCVRGSRVLAASGRPGRACRGSGKAALETDLHASVVPAKAGTQGVKSCAAAPGPPLARG